MLLTALHVITMLQYFEQGNAVHFCITVYVPIILSIFVHTSVYFLRILFCKVFDTAILYISFTIQGSATNCTYIEHKYMAHIAM
jgi:hypothetical protein